MIKTVVLPVANEGFLGDCILSDKLLMFRDDALK